MRKRFLVLFGFVFFSMILFAEITIYEEVGKNPSDAELDNRATEAQGITSDYSNWFFSNKDAIYRYDSTFDNVDLSINLDDINEMMEGVTCGHIGGIDYVDGHVYAGVDNCNKTTWVPSEGGNYDTIDDLQEAFGLYLRNKYSHLVTKYSAEEEFGGEGGILNASLAFYRLTYSINGNNVENCIIISTDNETWIPVYCYQETSYLMEFNADTFEFEGYREFLTADGLPIKSASSTSYNSIDRLFYNQCPENVTLNMSEKSKNLNAICGFDFDESIHTLILKSMINLGNNHPRHLTNDWSNQGGAFAENGVFLYVQDDKHDENSNMTGFQVYAPDYGKFRQDDGTGIQKYNAERFARGNIKMDPDFGDYGRWDELEGITVWRNSPLGGDIHIILLHNEYTDDYVNTSDDMFLYHFKSGDTDNDGFDDMIDNCPLIENNQMNFDNDGIGNVCDSDIDGDGFLNEDDSCPVLYDESNREIFFCEDVDKDEVCDFPVRNLCRTVFENGELDYAAQKSVYNQRWERRPVVFIDGVRNMLVYKNDIIISFVDNCPTIHNPFVNEESEIMFGVDPANKDAKTGVGAFNHPKANSYSSKYWNWGVRYNNYYWQPDHDLDGKGDVCDNGDPNNPDDVKTRYSRVLDAVSFTPKDVDPLIRNEYLKIDMKMYGQNESINDTKLQSLRYCNLPVDDNTDDFWGRNGYCANTKKSETYNNLTHKVADYSFSHGSEPVPKTGIKDNWRELRWTPETKCLGIQLNPDSSCFADKFPNAGTKGSTIYWEWRSNFFDDYTNMGSELYPKEIPEGWRDSFKYTLSVGVKGKSNNYITDISASNKQINPDHFYNKERYARSTRFYDLGIGYYKAKPLQLIEPEKMIYFDGWLRALMLRETLIRPWESNNEYFKWNGTWKDDITNIPFYITDDVFGAMTENNGFLLGVTENIVDNTVTVKYSNIENSAGWKDVATFAVIPRHLEPAGLSVGENTVFMLMKNEDSGEYHLFANNAGTLEEISSFDEEVKDMTFIEQGGIHYIAGNLDGYLEMFEIYQNENEGYAVRSVNSADKPSSRTLLNVFSDDSGIYLAGGGNTDGRTVEVKRDIWKFSSQNGWQVINSDTGKDLFKLFVRKQDDKLLLVSQTGLVDVNSAAYITVNVETGTIEEDGFVKIKGPGYESSYIYSPEFCIYENSGSIFPGSISADGNCLPVYDYKYETVSYFDYKRTIAGYNNNLYIGGLTGVRRVEIKEDGTLSNSDMLYTGETNNLAIYENTMYGANYGEIDIYSITEAGSISRVSGISSSSCGNVRVSNGKLFTAENKRVRVFDISNSQSPVLIKTIATSGKVIDLEVIGNRLYVYEETTSWFTTKGFTGIYDITNINSTVRTKYFEKRCTDAEMQSSGDFVYLGCKNGQFKVTDTGLTGVAGEKNFVREGYVNGKILYQVFSGALHKSKTSTVIAVCGNGVTENGEVCDGDTIQCSEWNADYIGGTAACNSTCDGYNEENCEVDGW